MLIARLKYLRFSWAIWFALLTAVTPLCGRAQVAASAGFRLTILHTNDLHGHIFPFAYTEVGRSKVEMPSVGGAARRATLVRRLRAEIKNPVMLVDSGDTFTRGPLTNAYEGIADTEAMNAVGYDLAALGNNEFKAKDATEEGDAAGAQSALLQVVKRSKFHWLCANAVDGKGAFLEGVTPYVVREINGVRVGFLGLTPARVASYPQAVGWTVSDPIEAAKRWIPEARRHCDILIALTHIGVLQDRELAARTTGLDAIVGGDSHTFLYKAHVIANLDGRKIPIVQDGEFGVNLGRLDLRFTRDAGGRWSLADYQYRLIPVSADIPEAPDVVKVLAPYLQPLLRVVGHIKTIDATPDQRSLQTSRIFVDALRSETGADYALNVANSGFEVFRHQDVTRYDVYAIWPFKDHVATATLTGAEIEKMLAKTSNAILSGVRSAIDPARSYIVAFVDYRARTDFGLPTDRVTDTGRDLRDIVMHYIAGMH